MWGLKIDQGVKRALWLTMLVVMVAKLSSWAFDSWMGDTQDEMIANQQALSRELSRRSSENHLAQQAEQMEVACRGILDRSPCLRPADFYEAGRCLENLSLRRCDRLEDVQLCAAVESLALCSDVFEDQKKNGCNRLRHKAECKARPAPEDPEELKGLWQIVFNDGLWHGDPG